MNTEYVQFRNSIPPVFISPSGEIAGLHRLSDVSVAAFTPHRAFLTFDFRRSQRISANPQIPLLPLICCTIYANRE